MDKANAKSAGRVVGIHSGALGDVILFAQMLAVARPAGGRIALVAELEKAWLLTRLGVIDDPLDFDALPMAETFSDVPIEAAALGSMIGRCDRLVSCFAAGDIAAERRLAGLCGAARADFLPVRPPAGARGHLLDIWAEQLGVPVPPAPAWTVPPPMREQAERALALAGADPLGPFVVLHPGSGGRDKCWPLPSFEALAESLLDPAVFVLGPAELDRWDAAAIDRLGRRHVVLKAPSLANLAGVLALAGGYVGNDSGPTHLAAAVGTPTLALFGPSEPAHFAPRGRKVRLLHAASLPDLSPADVLAAVQALGEDSV
jgi:hypothetical protein